MSTARDFNRASLPQLNEAKQGVVGLAVRRPSIAIFRAVPFHAD
jgi:hypothetical protein